MTTYRNYLSKSVISTNPRWVYVELREFANWEAAAGVDVHDLSVETCEDLRLTTREMK